jgi:hypothetical protein
VQDQVALRKAGGPVSDGTGSVAPCPPLSAPASCRLPVRERNCRPSSIVAWAEPRSLKSRPGHDSLGILSSKSILFKAAAIVPSTSLLYILGLRAMTMKAKYA